MSSLAPTTAVARPHRRVPNPPRRPRAPRSASDAAVDVATAPLTASVLRATAVPVPASATVPPPATEEDAAAATETGVPSRPAGRSALLHRIPRSRWPDGVPPVMGAHLLASHVVAPLSVSKGPGVDVTPHPFQYPASPPPTAPVSVSVHGAPASAARAAVDAILTAADAAVSARGAFSLALAGGSVLSALSGLAAAAKERGGPGSSFDKWTVAFVDERCVPLASPDSNAGAARAAFLAALAPAPTVLTLADALAATPDAAAVEYGGQLLRLPPSVLPRLTTPAGATLPSFDAVLLGIGPDAHVASLFPNAPALAAPEAGPWVVAVQNSPKPPAARVTLTLPALTAAANVIVLATGASKAAAVQRALEVQALPGACPAQMVRPHPANAGGTVRWLLDADAAGLLAPERWEDAKAWPRSAWAGKE